MTDRHGFCEEHEYHYIDKCPFFETSVEDVVRTLATHDDEFDHEPSDVNIEIESELESRGETSIGYGDTDNGFHMSVESPERSYHEAVADGMFLACLLYVCFGEYQNTDTQ